MRGLPTRSSPDDGGTQTVRNHRIDSRPHVQGAGAPLRLRHSARNLTDGGGLVIIRRLWDQLDLGTWIDAHACALGGYFRPSLMFELWVVLLLYGGRVLDVVPLLAELLWQVVRRRWARVGGAPKALTLVLDSTVVLRYGLKQAGGLQPEEARAPVAPSVARVHPG